MKPPNSKHDLPEETNGSGEGETPAINGSSSALAPRDEFYRMLDDNPLNQSAGRGRRRLAFFRRYWWVPALTLLVAVGGAIAYLRVMPPTFVSEARLWETEKLRLPEGAAFSEDAQNYYGTQIELLRSEKMAQGALARLQASGTNAVPRSKDGMVLPVELRVTQAPRSTVFVMQASSSDPAYTQNFLNALLDDYIAYRRNIRKVVSGDTLASISDQVLRLERDLKASQDALTAFQRTNNLAVLEEESRVAGGYLARLKTQRSDLQLEDQLLLATAQQQAANEAESTNSVSSLVDAVREPGSTSSESDSERRKSYQELALLQAEREKLSKYFRPKHPDIVKLDADIERAKRLIALYQSQTREQLAVDRQAVTMKVSNVETSIREWEGKLVQANAQIAEAERLKLAVSRTQGLYDRLLVLLQNVDISRNIDQETQAILERASIAERSYRREAQLLGLALAGGLLLGLGIVFLLELRDDRFTSASEVTDGLGDSLVGQIPEVRALRRKGGTLLLEAGKEPHIHAEAYRNLRSALLYQPWEGQRPKVLLITSALPDEGKSTVAANLARTLALGGSRVLLIDGDLRQGCLHDKLGKPVSPGFKNLLQEPATFASSLQTNGVPNLWFLPRGTCIGHPGDLLLGPAVEEVLTRCRQEFDFVLIDSSPVFAADDVTTLAPKVDGTLFVLRKGFSRQSIVREALGLLLQRQVKVIGLVFNRANTLTHSYCYHEYAGHETSKTSTSESPAPPKVNDLRSVRDPGQVGKKVHRKPNPTKQTRLISPTVKTAPQADKPEKRGGEETQAGHEISKASTSESPAPPKVNDLITEPDQPGRSVGQVGKKVHRKPNPRKQTRLISPEAKTAPQADKPEKRGGEETASI
jgi:polysaccharide biosynthesis transport protein